MRSNKVDLVMGEIPKLIKNEDGKMVPNPNYPSDGKCKTGHLIPGAWFFAISGRTLPPDRHGVYCDACIATANRIASGRKRS